jgi:hypothetical protein
MGQLLRLLLSELVGVALLLLELFGSRRLLPLFQ